MDAHRSVCTDALFLRICAKDSSLVSSRNPYWRVPINIVINQKSHVWTDQPAVSWASVDLRAACVSGDRWVSVSRPGLISVCRRDYMKFILCSDLQTSSIDEPERCWAAQHTKHTPWSPPASIYAFHTRQQPLTTRAVTLLSHYITACDKKADPEMYEAKKSKESFDSDRLSDRPVNCCSVKHKHHNTAHLVWVNVVLSSLCICLVG